jgi:dipeptidase D
VGELAGAVIEENEGYPAWEPDTGSELLQKCKDCYQAVFGEKPEVLIIHAGLECGVIAEKYPEMDMVSFGPDIENAHSPRERLSLSSLECTWRFLVKLLKSL